MPEYSRNAHEQCCVPALSAQSSPELFLSFKQCRVSALSAQSSPELFLSFKTDEMEGRPLRCVEQPKCNPEQSRKPPEAMEMHVTSAGTHWKCMQNKMLKIIQNVEMYVKHAGTQYGRTFSRDEGLGVFDAFNAGIQ